MGAASRSVPTSGTHLPSGRDPRFAAAVVDGHALLAPISTHGTAAGRTIEVTGTPVFTAMMLAARARNGTVATPTPAISDL
jgi:hypothetical protein